MKIEVKITGRDQAEMSLELENGVIKDASIKALGCHLFLEAIQSLRLKLKGPIANVELPVENDHASMLVRELIFRARGEWDFPYKDVELCHCRAVPTQRVDEAIITGSHTVQEVGEMCSAGTACGSCRPDTQKILDYRLCKKAA